MLVFAERGKPKYPEKNLSEQTREPTTNSTHVWHRVRESNPGHIGGRRVLSPLRHPCSSKWMSSQHAIGYSYFKKGCRKKMCTRQSRKVIRSYDQYTVPDDCSCRTYFCCFALALAFPWSFVPILSNLFDNKRTQNHPQCLSGLSRVLFPTTFLKIAVFTPPGPGGP